MDAKKYIVREKMYIRRSTQVSPETIIGELQCDFIIDIVDEEPGDFYESASKISNTWLKDANGFYYWKGGVEEYKPSFPAKPGMLPDFPYWMAELNLWEIWKVSTGKNIGVGIIDTGVNTNPDLKYITGKSVINDSDQVSDDDGHGTHCAGLIAGKNKNGQLIGVAPDCKLYACKISENGYLDKKNLLRYCSAIDWCAGIEEINIISISWASFINDEVVRKEIQKSIDNAVSKNKVVVCAMGNAPAFADASERYPVSLMNTIGVGVIPVEGKSYSFITDRLSVVTYGFEIRSYSKLQNRVEKMKGSSQATAIISGILALVLEREKPAKPYEFARAFIQNVTTIQDFSEGGKVCSLPVLDGSKLLKYFTSA
jgi:subtilisin family serine protease